MLTCSILICLLLWMIHINEITMWPCQPIEAILKVLQAFYVVFKSSSFPYRKDKVFTALPGQEISDLSLLRQFWNSYVLRLCLGRKLFQKCPKSDKFDISFSSWLWHILYYYMLKACCTGRQRFHLFYLFCHFEWLQYPFLMIPDGLHDYGSDDKIKNDLMTTK